MPVTDTEIEKLRDLLGRATSGPWVFEMDKDPRVGRAWIRSATETTDDGPRFIASVGNGTQASLDRASANAALIVAVVNALPSLLDQLERR